MITWPGIRILRPETGSDTRYLSADIVRFRIQWAFFISALVVCLDNVAL